MTNKEKFIDNSKNFIILFLIISAVFLMFKAVIYEPNSALFSLLGGLGKNIETKPVVTTNNGSSAVAAEPVFMLVTAEDGSHFAAKYDNQNKDELFSQFSAPLGEALGSSGTPNEISVQQWQDVLGNSGIFFDYLYPQPLSAIAKWLGTDISGNSASATARRLFLGNNNGSLMLYYIDEETGSIFACETASSFSTLTNKIDNYNMGSAKFAFELENEFAKIDPYFIFSNEREALRSVSVMTPMLDEISMQSLLNIFGINSFNASKANDGATIIYVEGKKSLQIDASGRVIFSVTGKSGVPIPHSSEELTLTDSITACSQIVEDCLGLFSGNGKLGLTSIKENSYPTFTTINYGYYIGGIPVTLPNGSFAASFQINGNAITRAEFYFREYSFTSETAYPLPEKQATAIIKQSGGEPILTYEDRGDNVICTWVNY